MKYIWRFVKFIIFCLLWCLLPVFASCVNIFAFFWWFGEPENGWFELHEDDYYWWTTNEEERTILIMTNQKVEYYKNPWDLLINKKSTY